MGILNPYGIGLMTIPYYMETMSGDSWMYPYQGTPMGNPYNISPI